MTPTSSLHSVTVERGSRIYKVSRYSKGFEMEVKDIDSGYEATYKGRDEVWQRAVKDRRGRMSDFVLSKMLLEELQGVQSEAEAFLPAWV